MLSNTVIFAISIFISPCIASRIDANLAASILTTVDSDANSDVSGSGENATLATSASDLCKALPQINRLRLRAMSDSYNRWAMAIACEEKKSMGGLGASTYHLRVTLQNNLGAQLHFATAVGKEKIVLSETEFKIPIGGVVRGQPELNRKTRQRFADVFGTTIDDFHEKGYFLIGSWDGKTVASEIGMRSARTKGFAMRENTKPHPLGFCSFTGHVHSKLHFINDLLFHSEHKPVELDACLMACESHMNPSQICLAITYDPEEKWCELSIRHVGMLQDQGSNQEVVSKVLTMPKKATMEMIKEGRLIQEQEKWEMRECQTCQCYVKDFDQPKIVDPEPVLFQPPPEQGIRDDWSYS